jgi:hypothetical protein
MKYSKPNFEHEWSEALRYREFEKMGKDGWLEKASKDFEISNFKSIEDVFNLGPRDYIVPWNLVSSATLLSLIPVMLLFFIAQKQFMESVARTGIKG